MAILGNDKNDLNAKVISMALRDSGFEIVYLGSDNTPEEIVKAALQEDVDAIFLSVPNKANINLIEETLKKANEYKFFDSPKKFMFVSGLELSNSEKSKLIENGITEIYNPKTKTHEIVNKIIELYELN